MKEIRTMEEQIDRVHKVYIKSKEYKLGKRGYQIHRLTADEIECIWEALSTYESMLKWRNEHEQ